MERGQEAAEEVPAEYHLPPRQRARGGSSKYASALPGAYSMLYSRIKAMEDEVRTIKALALSKEEKQYHEPRNKLVEGVRSNHQTSPTPIDVGFGANAPHSRPCVRKTLKDGRSSTGSVLILL